MTKYRFVGASGEGPSKRLYWESEQTYTNDSRVESISCRADWFWGRASDVLGAWA